MTTSHTAELRDIIDRAFTADLGGRATARMVQEGVQPGLPAHLVDYLINKGLRSQITAYFREKDAEGLPMRPSVNDADEHAQIELLSVAEFAYAHAQYVTRAQDNMAQADKLRQRCLETHGVDLIAGGAA
jgi:hypothetical protein